MRGYVSVLKLYTRGTIYQIVLRTLILVGVECGMFAVLLRKYAWGLSIGATKLTALFDNSRLSYVFLLGVIFCVMNPLSEMGANKAGRLEYTMQRLSIPYKHTVLVQWGYNTACYLLFWMIQTMVVLGMCQCYFRLVPSDSINHQTLVLAFYQQDFLHNLLPLSDWYRWVRNLMLVVTLGLMTSRFTDLQRRGRKTGSGMAALIWLTGLSFFSEAEQSCTFEIFIIAICAAIMFFSLVNISVGEDEEDEAEDNPSL